MPASTYPGATSQDRSQFAGITMPRLEKVLWHTTESAGWPAYPTFAPHLTVDPVLRQIRQHMPLNRSASTLADPSSTAVLENRDNVVQIEIVGYCDPARASSSKHISKWGDAEYQFLAGVAAWFWREWGVPLTSTVRWVSYPASYGVGASQRLSGPAYDAYRGHLGHQHAPGNSHGDPGNIDIVRLLRFAREITGGTGPTPDPKPAPPSGRPVPQPYAPGQILPGGSITTPFGAKGDWAAGFHTGDDWNVGDPTEDYWFPLYASKPGVVRYVGEDGWGKEYGRQVHVEYADGRRGAFCHMAAYSVKPGQRVEPGTQVGRVGYSGNVSPEGKDGSHCHYEERVAPYRYGTDARKPVYTADAWSWDGKSYPGSERLQAGAEGPWVTLLGRRLVAHGYDGYQVGPGPVWGPADSAGVVWLKQQQGWSGGPGVGQATWDLLMTEPQPQPEPEEPAMTNLRIGVLNVGDNNDEAGRRAGLVKALSEMDASIYLLQECSLNEYPALFQALGGKLGVEEWTKITRATKNDGKLGLYKAGNRVILFDPGKWDLRSRASVTLTPDARQVPAVRLRSRATGAELAVGSVHLSYTAAKAAARDGQARQLVAWIDKLGWDMPWVLGGDWNDSGTVANPGSVRDIMRRAGYTSGLELTRDDTPTHRAGRIDDGLFSADFDVRAITIGDSYGATDHRPLLLQGSILTPR